MADATQEQPPESQTGWFSGMSDFLGKGVRLIENGAVAGGARVAETARTNAAAIAAETRAFMNNPGHTTDLAVSTLTNGMAEATGNTIGAAANALRYVIAHPEAQTLYGEGSQFLPADVRKALEDRTDAAAKAGETLGPQIFKGDASQILGDMFVNGLNAADKFTVGKDPTVAETSDEQAVADDFGTAGKFVGPMAAIKGVQLIKPAIETIEIGVPSLFSKLRPFAPTMRVVDEATAAPAEAPSLLRTAPQTKEPLLGGGPAPSAGAPAPVDVVPPPAAAVEVTAATPPLPAAPVLAEPVAPAPIVTTLAPADVAPAAPTLPKITGFTPAPEASPVALSVEAPPVVAPLTEDAVALLKRVDAGGVPMGVTRSLRSVAEKNGIPVTEDTKPETIIDALRAKQPAAPAPVVSNPEDWGTRLEAEAAQFKAARAPAPEAAPPAPAAAPIAPEPAPISAAADPVAPVPPAEPTGFTAPDAPTPPNGAGAGTKLDASAAYRIVHNPKMRFDLKLAGLIKGGRPEQADRLIADVMSRLSRKPSAAVEKAFDEVRDSVKLSETPRGKEIRQQFEEAWNQRTTTKVRDVSGRVGNIRDRLRDRSSYLADTFGYVARDPWYTAVASGRAAAPTLLRSTRDVAAVPFTAVAQITAPVTSWIPVVGRLAGATRPSMVRGLFTGAAAVGTDWATGDHLGVGNALVGLYNKELELGGSGLDLLSRSRLVGLDPTGATGWALWGAGKGMNTAAAAVPLVASFIPGATSTPPEIPAPGQPGSAQAALNKAAAPGTTAPAPGTNPGAGILNWLESRNGGVIAGGIAGFLMGTGGSWQSKLVKAALGAGAGDFLESETGKDMLRNLEAEFEDVFVKGNKPTAGGMLAWIEDEAKNHPIMAAAVGASLLDTVLLGGGSSPGAKLGIILAMAFMAWGFEKLIGMDKMPGLGNGIGEEIGKVVTTVREKGLGGLAQQASEAFSGQVPTFKPPAHPFYETRVSGAPAPAPN